ncbi:MAG: pyruvate:ferredoxin (flavodoxin) oxidoreductase [Sterolibacterium sp.]|nr:pyruvate:ferredoxin (flavodoxin) oxidoreductase [Sterolibacterium sp.]
MLHPEAVKAVEAELGQATHIQHDLSKHRGDIVTVDGNEAAAYIAHLTNEVIAIYPITPSSPMGELSDQWSSQGVPNLWGTVPTVIEMQHEGGAAGAVHGALQTGALATTFTSSQGLLLMIPNMFKIAGELTATVFHVAARTLATHALSIFGDHSDVMAVRSTGWAMLSSNSVQEAHDFALIAQAATLEARLPVMHFFDGFRTSHEVSKIEQISHETVRQMISDELVQAHRARALSPESPVVRGTSQNPDVFFQMRESINPFYAAMSGIMQAQMDKFAALTGRQYRLYEYVGAPDAERVIVIMGSGATATEEVVEHLNARGEKLGVLKVRLYRPFDPHAMLTALPATVKKIAVLDRCKEPGADGEPLYKDVLVAIAEAFGAGDSHFTTLPRVVGGRYGLSSKEFTPGMIKAVFDELAKPEPKKQFTVGIHDDLSHTSLDWDENFSVDAGQGVVRAMFYGLGSDGTVSANKNSIKIIGEETDQFCQGYFVYDSKKAGAMTISHLRFGSQPIRSSYLIGDNQANFVACHVEAFLQRYDILDVAAEGAVFLLNSTAAPDKVWQTLPRRMQQQFIDKKMKFFTIDAYAVARKAGMGSRTNTVMQTCFFAISNVIPRTDAIDAIKRAVLKTYGKSGKEVVEKNYHAIDEALANLHEVSIPAAATSEIIKFPPVAADSPEFVCKVTGEIIAGRGDRIPVSLFPADGTFPHGTTKFEKRNLAQEIPVWTEELCIHCGKCPFVCPHAAIRSKAFPANLTASAPSTFKHVPIKGKEFEAGLHISYQVSPEDCTGCGLCVEICPAADKKDPTRKALMMAPVGPLKEQEKDNWGFFLGLPEYDREKIKLTTMKGAMLTQPLFEFSGACVGCGETPYVKLATQLFGDRMVVANATGCSSIYGGNLPSTPWTANAEGRGPAWSNSLFEDNAEFGLGFRVTIDKQNEYARELIGHLRKEIGEELSAALLNADQFSEAGIHQQQERVGELKRLLAGINSPQARELVSVADALVKRSVWIMGGDGWAYDIGFSGLDHVIASGRNVNILVLDTEVYSNTGGQASKSTPFGAVAKFAAKGKATGKKDLAQIAMTYGNVYVARVAFGAKDVHTLRTFIDAESYDGPSLIIAYSPCREQGFDLSNNINQQQLAVDSGHWPLFSFDPRLAAEGKNPMQMDSKRPSIPYKAFASTETRFREVLKSKDVESKLAEIQKMVDDRYAHYEQLASVGADESGTQKP